MRMTKVLVVEEEGNTHDRQILAQHLRNSGTHRVSSYQALT